MYCAAEDKPLERAEIVKGYEYSKNHYVVVEPEELEKMAPPTATAMEILQFARMDEIDPIFLEKSYYVAPEKGLGRPYALLLEAMKETKYDAIAKVSMHGREHVAILRPSKHGIVLHTMYFMNEIHQAKEAGSSVGATSGEKKFGKKEMDLAKKLIETLAGTFDPKQYHDEYKENVEQLIAKKRKGQKITPIRQPKRAPVTDLMEALQQSLSQKGKTSASGATGRTSGKLSHKRRAKVA